jgi:predicted membrane channel-forming protein YqfA (hemolysin III family)
VGQIPIVFLITPLETLFPRERYPVFFFVTSFIVLILVAFVYFFFRETSGLTDKEKKNIYAKKSK